MRIIEDEIEDLLDEVNRLKNDLADKEARARDDLLAKLRSVIKPLEDRVQLDDPEQWAYNDGWNEAVEAMISLLKPTTRP